MNWAGVYGIDKRLEDDMFPESIPSLFNGLKVTKGEQGINC